MKAIERQERALEAAGLSPNERKCYRALLQLGKGTANQVSRKSGIHRVAVYDALRGLQEYALVSQVTEGKGRVYSPVSPKRVTELLEAQKEQIIQASEGVPQLMAQFSAAMGEEEIRVFKGLIGVKQVLKEMIDDGNDICDFGSEYHFKEFFPQYNKQWDRERKRKKIHFRIVANEKIRGSIVPLSEMRFIPRKFTSRVSTFTFGKKVGMIMWVEMPMAIIIDQPAIHESYQSYFEYLWSVAKR